MNKEEKEAILPEVVKPFENAPMVQMTILDLLQLVKRYLETGRVDLAVSLIVETINQLEKQNVREPKLQDEEGVKGSSSEG